MSEAVLGVDIAKKKFDVAPLVKDKLKHKVFANDQARVCGALGLAHKAGGRSRPLLLEASSTYGEELAAFLYAAGQNISIVNPARIKGFAQSELLRTKTDKVDAGVIARFCAKMSPELWYRSHPRSGHSRRW